MKTITKSEITSLRDYGIVKEDDFKKLHTFNFTGKKDSHPHRVQTFKCIDKIFWKDEKTGETTERVIRFIEGERSIFADEQDLTNSYADRNQVDRRIYRIKVMGNVYNVAGNNINLLAFMRLWNINGSNERRDKSQEIKFFEYKPEQVAKKSLEREGAAIKARYKAYQELSIDEVKAVLVVLAKDPSEYEKILNDKMSDELRNDALVYAGQNPVKFLEILESDSMKYKYTLCKAVAMKIIKVSESGTEMTWNDGGLLFECNIGKNVLDEVASRYAGGEERATKVYKEIKLKLDAFFPSMPEPKPTLAELTPLAAPKKGEEETPKQIYDRLKAYKQLKHIGVKVQVHDMEWSTIGSFLKDLKENKEKYDKLKLIADQAEVMYKKTLQP